MTEERTLTISFSRIFYKQYYKRSNKAIDYLRMRLRKEVKVDKIDITNELNAEIWNRGQNLNKRRIKVRVTIDKENNQAKADVFEHAKAAQQEPSSDKVNKKPAEAN